MVLRILWVLGGAGSLLACATPPPASSPTSSPKTSEPPPTSSVGSARLRREGSQWFVIGLAAQTVRALNRGAMLAAYRPLGSGRQRPIATLQMLGPVGDHTIEVAPHCLVKGERLEDHLAVEPLDHSAMKPVGQCLAQVVDHGGEGRRAYVVLNVGQGDRVQPGDEYLLLGKPVVQPGFVPLGFDHRDNARCKIPRARHDMTLLTARCNLIEQPFGGVYVGRYAIYFKRTVPAP